MGPEVCLLHLHHPDGETLFQIAFKKFPGTSFSGFVIAHYCGILITSESTVWNCKVL